MLVVDCYTYAVVYSFAYPQTIKAATFIYSNHDLIAVTGTSTAHLFDTRSSTLYDITAQLPASSVLATNFNHTVFYCHNNQINQYSFEFGPLTVNSTNSTAGNYTNATDSGNSSSGTDV